MNKVCFPSPPAPPPDADVIDAFLASKGRPDWATLISIYRNATVPEGYLDFATKHDAREVIQLCAHLKDVLTRIVLKECDYDGSYDSLLGHSFGRSQSIGCGPTRIPLTCISHS